MAALRIAVRYANREEVCFVHDLRELAAWIDDFATDHCEQSRNLFIRFDGDKTEHYVDIYCEEVCENLEEYEHLQEVREKKELLFL